MTNAELQAWIAHVGKQNVLGIFFDNPSVEYFGYTDKEGNKTTNSVDDIHYMTIAGVDYLAIPQMDVQHGTSRPLVYYRWYITENIQGLAALPSSSADGADRPFENLIF